LQRFDEQRKQHEAAEARASATSREEYIQKMRNEAKGSPKLTQPTDILKAFAMDQQRTQGSKPPSEQQSKGNRSMTAACLIDAIIVHQINQSTEETPTSSTAVSQAGPMSAMKQEVRSNVPQHSNQMYRQSQSHPSQGNIVFYVNFCLGLRINTHEVQMPTLCLNPFFGLVGSDYKDLV
jgi:hypothetical protein